MKSSLILLTLRLAGACTLVEGDRIAGRDLASEHPDFAAVDPNADVGPAPLAGARRSFSHFEVERLARQLGIALSGEGSREACFERATIRLGAALLSPILAVPEGDILDFSRQALPLGKPEFRPEGRSPTGLWTGRWLYGENRSAPIWVRVPPSAHAGPNPRSRREVDRGDQVRVEVYSGGVLLAFDAAAENAGHIGESVTVRNPANGQRFRARVEASGKVSIRK